MSATKSKGKFFGTLTPIFSGSTASRDDKWMFTDFYDKVIAAHKSVKPQWWPGYGSSRDLPGIESTYQADGVSQFANHILMWSGDRIRWSDIDDFSTWIPVGSTAGTGNTSNVFGFTQPAAGENTAPIFVTDRPLGWVEEMFVRIDNNPLYDFYSVVSVSKNSGGTATAEQFSHNIPANSTGYIYIKEGTTISEDSYIKTPTSTNSAKVVKVGPTILRTNTIKTGFTPPVDSVTEVTIEFTDSILWEVNNLISVGWQDETGKDVYRITAIDGGNNSIKAVRLFAGVYQVPNYTTGVLSYVAGDGAVTQPYLQVANESTTEVLAINPSVEISEGYFIVLKNLGLNGGTPAGNSIPANSTISAMEANEAGELVNVGSRIQGGIFNIVEMGDEAYIFKARSIQSMQYVGKSGGVFVLRKELSDDGPIGRNAMVLIGEDVIYFWGQRDIYAFSGGRTITPIGQSATRQAFAELDNSRRDEIFAFHREQDYEVTFVYPVVGDSTISKCLIFNYRENSVVNDVYDSTYGNLTAGGYLDWRISKYWNSTLNGWDDQVGSWLDYKERSIERLTVVASDSIDSGPGLVAQGRLYSRLDQGYNATAETTAYDFGDPFVWKYAEQVILQIEVKDLYNNTLKDAPKRPCRLWVQVGGLDNLDSVTRWSDPTYVEASGNGTITTKVSARVAGRLLKLRFYTENTPDINWRISGWKIIARPGGTY